MSRERRRSTYVAGREELAIGRESQAVDFATIVVEDAASRIGRKTVQMNFFVLHFNITSSDLTGTTRRTAYRSAVRNEITVDRNCRVPVGRRGLLDRFSVLERGHTLSVPDGYDTAISRNVFRCRQGCIDPCARTGNYVWGSISTYLVSPHQDLRKGLLVQPEETLTVCPRRRPDITSAAIRCHTGNLTFSRLSFHGGSLTRRQVEGSHRAIERPGEEGRFRVGGQSRSCNSFRRSLSEQMIVRQIHLAAVAGLAWILRHELESRGSKTFRVPSRLNDTTAFSEAQTLPFCCEATSPPMVKVVVFCFVSTSPRKEVSPAYDKVMVTGLQSLTVPSALAVERYLESGLHEQANYSLNFSQLRPIDTSFKTHDGTTMGIDFADCFSRLAVVEE
jgi:hypothetical protein